MARNCDQIATMRRGTGRDGCPTPTGGMAVELGRQGRGGTERMGGDGRAMATDLAVGGSNPSRHATKTAGQSPMAAWIPAVAACWHPTLAPLPCGVYGNGRAHLKHLL